MSNRNFLRNSFPREKKGAIRNFSLIFIISSGDFSAKNKSSSDTRPLGQDKLSWWLKFHQRYLSMILYITVPMTNGQCSTNSVLPWKTQSGSWAELVLPATGKYSHKYLPMCGLMFALQAALVQLCTTSHMMQSELRRMHGTKVFNEKTWKHKNETDRLHICKVTYMPEKQGRDWKFTLTGHRALSPPQQGEVVDVCILKAMALPLVNVLLSQD